MEAQSLSETVDDENLEELEAAGHPGPPRRLPPFLRLTRRTCVFLLLTLVSTTIFFVTGSAQTFLDSNLSLLLAVIAGDSIALTLVSLAGIVGCVVHIVHRPGLRLFVQLAGHAVLLVVGAAAAMVSLVLSRLSEGFDL